MNNEAINGFNEAKVRKAFRVNVPSAILLGLVMVCWPVGFWRLLGIELGEALFPAILYGSVILGVGLASIAGVQAPRCHVGLLLLLVCYKGMAVLFLTIHSLVVLSDGKSVPPAVWVIIALWLSQAITNARLYPWGLKD